MKLIYHIQVVVEDNHLVLGDRRFVVDIQVGNYLEDTLAVRHNKADLDLQETKNYDYLVVSIMNSIFFSRMQLVFDVKSEIKAIFVLLHYNEVIYTRNYDEYHID